MNLYDKINPSSLLTYEQQILLYQEEMGRQALHRQLQAQQERSRSVSRQRRRNLKQKKEAVLP